MKTAQVEPWAGDRGWFDYFLALQVGQVAQVALPSVQHFIPQADAASFLAQHLWLAQPATRAEAQTIRARSFSVFIYLVLCLSNARRQPRCRTTE